LNLVSSKAVTETMLIPRYKKNKLTKNQDAILKKGLLLLKDKLYKQAMIELKIALQHNPSAVIPELEILFEKYEEGESIEIALTIGLVLFQVNKSEELALKLGNYSRKLKNYKQANSLYREALKINRNNKLAFYNLAASMGKVDKYDQDVIKLINRHFDVNDYVFPNYIGGNATINQLKEEIKKTKFEQRNYRIKQLQTLKEGIDDSKGNQSLETIEVELEQLTSDKIEVSLDELTEAFQKKRDEASGKKMNLEEQNQYYTDIFNFGLYALLENDIGTALDNFLLLKQREQEIEDLDLCLALASDLNGHREEALRIMQKAINQHPENRLLNINLALIFKKNGNKLLSYKYQAIASSLLEKSDGCMHLSEMMDRADNHFKHEKLDDALKLYRIVAVESNHIKAWLNIGEIYFLKKRHIEALEAFKEIQKIDPDSKLVQHKMKDIHDHYCLKGDELFNESKFSQAAVLYERALNVVRTAETIEKLISVYKRLNKNRQVQDLYEEQQVLYKKQIEIDKENKRLDYIEQGKIQLRLKNFDAAINNFENAFGLRADKDVFAFLAHIYKSLNRKRMLKDLVERWKMTQENVEQKEDSESLN